MGNCQAIDASMLVIQHPSGRVERLYWPVSVREVMRTNPNHYVALVVTLCSSTEEKRENNGERFTRVKLLKRTDTLVLGQAYRLITSQEVMKGMWAKKDAKMMMMKKRNQPESTEKLQRTSEKESLECEVEAAKSSGLEKSTNQGKNYERHRQRPKSMPSAAGRLTPWRPSLQSISEAGS